MANEPDVVALPLVWDAADVPVLVANMFALLGADADGFFFTVGQVVPPPSSGTTDADRRESLEKVGVIHIKPIGQFSLSPTRLRELHNMLDRVVNQMDQDSK